MSPWMACCAAIFFGDVVETRSPGGLVVGQVVDVNVAALGQPVQPRLAWGTTVHGVVNAVPDGGLKHLQVDADIHNVREQRSTSAPALSEFLIKARGFSLASAARRPSCRSIRQGKQPGRAVAGIDLGHKGNHLPACLLFLPHQPQERLLFQEGMARLGLDRLARFNAMLSGSVGCPRLPAAPGGTRPAASGFPFRASLAA